LLRKKLIELFRKEDLGIEANANLKSVDFLDVHFNLSQKLLKADIEITGQTWTIQIMEKKGTMLSKFIWELKDEGVNFEIKWRIVDRAPPYNPRTRKCMLCTKEAYYINYHRHMATLNKRKEIFGACRHRNMETLSNVWRFFLFIFIY